VEVREETRERRFTISLNEQEMRNLTQVLWRSPAEESGDLFCAMPPEFTAKVSGPFNE
jgi:hypothetical protein